MGKNKDSMVLSISLVDIGRDEMNKHESDLFDSLPGEVFVICNVKDDLKGSEMNVISRRAIKGSDIKCPTREEFMKDYYGEE
tara:strand:- start:38 stop:283 length:246 start_codon:yes stop_codon:yes gene_type:complete